MDIDEDEFYRRLTNAPVLPSTMQPSPQDFTETYEGLVKEASGIVSIHLSSKLSGTYNAAVSGKAAVRTACPIEVIDSRVVTMGLGELVIVANEMAEAGRASRR